MTEFRTFLDNVLCSLP